MAKKKAPKKRARVTLKEITPNHLTEPQTAEDVAALQVTCKYLGKIFYEGNTICYDQSEWQCGPAGWVKTGNAC